MKSKIELTHKYTNTINARLTFPFFFAQYCCWQYFLCCQRVFYWRGSHMVPIEDYYCDFNMCHMAYRYWQHL